MAGELLHGRELHALRGIQLPVGPSCRLNAPAQFGKVRVRNVHLKRANGVLVGGPLDGWLESAGRSHGVLLVAVMAIF
jgi:hypothetical protein